ncbi:MAG: peptidogalycan biosysnthesis protein, partial [Aliihoeflea sp.]
MSDNEAGFVIRVVDAMASIRRDDWDRLAGTARASETGTYNPFVSYDFLSTLEDSGCVGAHAGWLPQHLALQAP